VADRGCGCEFGSWSWCDGNVAGGRGNVLSGKYVVMGEREVGVGGSRKAGYKRGGYANVLTIDSLYILYL
jgi:hypothetical protein